MSKLIQTAYIHIPGNSSVGLHPVDIKVTGLNLSIHSKHDKDLLEEDRSLLEECFGEIYGSKCTVLFDFEADKINNDTQKQMDLIRRGN